MENNQFLIPANTKKGQLILSVFRPIDLAIAVTGASLSLILLILFSNMELKTWVNLLAVVPILLCGALVYPVPNYHNVLVAIQEVIAFYSNNRNYKWRGWCVVYESRREQ